ncbi:hypothetical protein BDR26DRAFT_896755 [Obelidium mucronatum]|nr:hypothetical protein BDR26DRAFT_896755 [Obelidium mucronatum]
MASVWSQKTNKRRSTNSATSIPAMAYDVVPLAMNQRAAQQSVYNDNDTAVHIRERLATSLGSEYRNIDNDPTIHGFARSVSSEASSRVLCGWVGGSSLALIVYFKKIVQ